MPLWICIAGALQACTAGDLGPLPLTDNALWQVLSTGLDPLPDHQPELIDCVGFWEEQGLLEIDTDYCNYLSITQPSLVEIRRGWQVQIALVHDDLLSEEPAEAHAAVFLGQELLWERLLPVPSPAMFHTPEIDIDDKIPAGTPVIIHLHNHGANNWRLLPVEVSEKSE